MVLQKSGKDDYTRVPSYRPMALLNTLRKVLESMLVRRISHMVERHSVRHKISYVAVQLGRGPFGLTVVSPALPVCV